MPNKSPDKCKYFEGVPANYRRWVLRRAKLAASSLPPPEDGTLRQAAQAAVDRLQTGKAAETDVEMDSPQQLPEDKTSSTKQPSPV